MLVLMPEPVKGYTFNSEHGLTLNFDPSVNVQKLPDGVYIPKDGFGHGLDGTIDNWTVKAQEAKTADGHTLIDLNQEVVTCIYTLSRRKVTSRATVNSYATSATTKTVNDVMDEFNCAMDAYKALGQGIPDGLPSTSYVLTPGDLFQFREDAKPWIPPVNSKGQTWLCAMDDMNRYEDDPILALFYIDEVEYNDPNMRNYMTKLSLKCVWTTLADFTVGQTYTAVKS